jgi:hypothetical protein
MMLARGRLAEFVACFGKVAVDADERATIDRATAALLGAKPGDSFLAMGR